MYRLHTPAESPVHASMVCVGSGAIFSVEMRRQKNTESIAI